MSFTEHEIVEHELFGGRVRVAQTTKAAGSFHPEREDFPAQFRRIQKYCGVEAVLAPSLAFSNGMVMLDRMPDESCFLLNAASRGHGFYRLAADEVMCDPGAAMAKRNPIEGFYRSINPADAGLTSTLPVVMFNADCPIGVVYAEHAGRAPLLVVLYLGLMSVISKDGRRSLIDVVLDYLQVHDFYGIRAWSGFGVESCCYGLSDADDRWPFIDREQGSRHRTVRWGPREGQRAVDLPYIIRHQFIRRLSSRVHMSGCVCTVCGARHPNYGIHFSNMMGCDPLERNAVIVQLT